MLRNILYTVAFGMLLSACGTMGEPTEPSKTPPKFTGVKIGEPYSVAGKWYKPEADPTYDKTGMASWYGPGFNGKMTANGETYNKHDLTAAHPTLPMPSFVKVTNLENGRSAVVRVNDRGPFHSDRIIDLSEASAKKLGITGTSQVRVQYLKEETDIYIASNGTIWPEELQMAQNNIQRDIMPRETMSLTPAQDAHYYQVNDAALQQAADSHDFKPAPLEIAQNQGSVVSSVPVLSVSSKDTMPPFIKSAEAEEAPYPSALQQKPETTIYEEAKTFKAEIKAAPDPYGRELNNNLSSEEKSKTTQVVLGKDVAPSPDSRGEVKPSAWSVQIASFSERVNADKLTQKLMVLGQPELQPVLVDGKQWYRVYLHPLSPQVNKDALLAELQKMGLRDARIVK